MLFRTLADVIALVHLLMIGFLVLGAGLAWRRPWLLAPHAGLLTAVAAVNLSGSDCPLTVLEKELRQHGGEQAYAGGFLEHYVVTPLHPAGITPAVDLLIQALVVLPAAGFAVAWALRLRRHGGLRPVDARPSGHLAP